MKKLLSSTFFMLFLLAMTTSTVYAAPVNLITNGGFETLGSYGANGLYSPVGWTVADSSPSLATGTFSMTYSQPPYHNFSPAGLQPAEGDSFLWGGAYSGNIGSISQNLTTTSGQTYNLQFSLANKSGGQPNSWSIIWNGSPLASGSGLSDFGYANHDIIVTGTGNDSLKFAFNNEGTAFALDKVSLSPTPIPGIAWLLGSGIMGLVGLRRKLNL